MLLREWEEIQEVLPSIVRSALSQRQLSRGRHGSVHEAFVHVTDSMDNQLIEWLTSWESIPRRTPCSARSRAGWIELLGGALQVLGLAGL